MSPRFLGLDRADVRVRSLAAVEAFYDAFMPELGLVEKTCGFVEVGRLARADRRAAL